MVDIYRNQTDRDSSRINRTSPRWSRRRILQTLGFSSAAFSSTLGTVSADGSEDEWVKIPRRVSRGEVVSTIVVPRVWNEQRYRAREVRSKLIKDYKNDENVRSISITAGDRRVDGSARRFLAVKVSVDSIKQADFSDSIQDVEIQVEEYRKRRRTESGTGCLNKDTFDPIPGGVYQDTIHGTGTTTCRVEKNQSYYMLSAAHLFYDGDNCGDIEGGSVFNYDIELYGRVSEHFDNRHDWALIDPLTSSGFSLNGNVQTWNHQKPVAGYLPKSALDHKMSMEEPVKKIGINTGETTGQIAHIESWGNEGCVFMDGHGVTLTNHQAKGDSGAPVFEMAPNNVWMISIGAFGAGNEVGTACGAPRYEGTDGWPAYKLAEDNQVYFATNL